MKGQTVVETKDLIADSDEIKKNKIDQDAVEANNDEAQFLDEAARIFAEILYANWVQEIGREADQNGDENLIEIDISQTNTKAA